MGLHICYDLSLPADTPESDVRELVERLHARAGALPFQSVSPVVTITPGDPIPASSWAPRDITDAATRIGFTVEVRDQTGYWPDRDTAKLLASVHEFNGIVARFAGALHDQISCVGTVHGPVIDHPEFEHLEMERRQQPRKPDDQ